MIFAQIINEVAQQYPVSEAQLRAQFPGCALPADLSTCAYIQSNGWVIVAETPPPIFNEISETITDGVEKINDQWVQTWQITPLPPETVAANIAAKSAEIYNQLDAAVSDHLNEQAVKMGYENRLSICAYINSAIPKFNDEAAAFVAWRDQVWSVCLQILSDVSAGARQPPTAEQLIAELPEFTL